MDYEQLDFKKDMFAIAVACSLAFLVGLVGGQGTLTTALAIALPTYIGMRYLQIKGIL